MKRQEVIDTLARHIEQLHEMGVKSLSLFGSVARDDAREDSDIDLLVEFAHPVSLFGFARLQLYLQELFGEKKVDLVMRHALIEELRDIILKEAVHAV